MRKLVLTLLSFVALAANAQAPSGVEIVDLGLSVKWASMNVGAAKAEDYGDYFAWGETTGYNSGKTDFSWSSYKYCNGTYSTMTKYCLESTYGNVDNKSVLDASDDAATANWGSDWRMPTYSELEELYNSDNCLWTWYSSGNTEFNGVAGYKIQSKKSGYTDKFIFIPAAGYRADSSICDAGEYGACWSSTLCDSYSPDGTYIYSDSSRHGLDHYKRCHGRSVRPVYDPKPSAPEGVQTVEIGGVKWATMNVGATTVAGDPATCYGDYYVWSETEPRYTSITITGAKSATFGGWKSEHSRGYSTSDRPSYTDATLDAEHDAATQNWGSEWRTPTNEEFKALRTACNGGIAPIIITTSFEPTGGIYWLYSDQTCLPEYTGVAGTLFVDNTDTSKRLFFPASGFISGTTLCDGGDYSNYWTSTNLTSQEAQAYDMHVDRAHAIVTNSTWNFNGFPVRPIYDPKPVSVQSVTADSAPASAKPRKFIKDGRICIGDYNIAGQRVK